MPSEIVIKGAREHNLRNLTLRLPRDKFIVFTGISGSGKSSLVIDTIYAEGQRRYVESLSSYARQFLGELNKPDVDQIDGLSPAICIDQKTTSRNPRSTVGTVTEIYDYLRLLYARIGEPHCPNCGKKISQQTSGQIIESIMNYPAGTKFSILAPVIKGRKGIYNDLFERLKKDGYARVMVDGAVYSLDEEIGLDRDIRHEIDVIVDRLIMKDGLKRRLSDSVETALKLGEGAVTVLVQEDEDTRKETFSTLFACLDCGISLGEIAPRNFSFNSPYGACPECTGLGYRMEADPESVIDKNLSIDDGAILPFSATRIDFYPKIIRAVCDVFDIPMDVPWSKLTEGQQKTILYGTGEEKVAVKYRSMTGEIRSFNTAFEGVLPSIHRRFLESESDSYRERLREYMFENACGMCGGARLKKESLSVTIGGLNIADSTSLSIDKMTEFIQSLELTDTQKHIARRVIKEISERLKFLTNVGLSYLTLSRSAGTLAGGEAQRIRLATQLGSGLAGVLYVLDEPSIGLHQRDNGRLIKTLKHLQSLGNTLLIVEHDEETIAEADHIVDIGPGAGRHGGRVSYEGDYKGLLKSDTLTGEYLSGRRMIEIPLKRREGDGRALKVFGARENNLKNVDLTVPLGVFTCITGVSGSGKSSLVVDILWKALARKFFRNREQPGKHDRVEGLELIDKIVEIDQSPIGRTPRSNPVTYIGVFDEVRKVFTMLEESQIRGYKPGRFSFNVKGGRCEACSGDGTLKIEMHFLPDVYVTCDVCKGRRYNNETLEVKFKGKNIADVLDMSVEEALDFFKNVPKIKRRLQTLNDVGLGYIHLGQAATTLSGGEAQRVKLASELCKIATGKTVYILDEPTTGLHFEDIRKLLGILHKLVESGNTVIVIEHNLDVIKTADHVVDLGPEGGDGGGEIIATGTPEQIAKEKRSYTGKYLKKILSTKA